MKSGKKHIKMKPIYVTQPSLAPLEEYLEMLKPVWETGILTHNGPLVQKLEKEICKKLNINNFVAVSNGTIAIQMAIKALDLKGEIITPAFTWIATVSAIKCEGCEPIFCDIDPDTLNIDTSEIEKHITKKTVAIIPVHVFGNPCKVDEIDKIATRYNLKVIYDAAHAIGTTYNGNSVLEHGDISTTSLHATKLLNSAEGGGCITNDMVYNSKLEKIRFFGHNEEKDDIIMDGFNGKLTEVHAALGLVNLKYFNDVLAKRKELYNKYLTELENQPLDFHAIEEGTNFSYFPIIFKNENELLEMEKTLNENNIFPRRYFFPSVNTFTKIVAKQSCPVSEDISNRILCLPLYFKLSNSDVEKIASIIRND